MKTKLSKAHIEVMWRALRYGEAVMYWIDEGGEVWTLPAYGSVEAH